MSAIPLVISSNNASTVVLANGVIPTSIWYRMTPIDHQSTGKPVARKIDIL